MPRRGRRAESHPPARRAPHRRGRPAPHASHKVLLRGAGRAIDDRVRSVPQQRVVVATREGRAEADPDEAGVTTRVAEEDVAAVVPEVESGPRGRRADADVGVGRGFVHPVDRAEDERVALGGAGAAPEGGGVVEVTRSDVGKGADEGVVTARFIVEASATAEEGVVIADRIEDAGMQSESRPRSRR